MKRASVFLALGSILLIIIGISMFVTKEELFATAVFIFIGGVTGIAVFWFIFYFSWIEPKNTNYSKTDQIIVTNKKPLNQDFKNKNYYWDIADKLNAFCIYTIYYFKRNIDKIEEQLIQRANTMTNFDTSKQEQKSWKFNLLIIQNLLLDSKLPDDVLIVFEWIQKNQTRIDITLLGVDKNNKRNIMTIEIKNWSARSTGWNIYWEKDQARKRNPHPYHKAEKQYLAISELLRQKGLNSIINLKSCAYLPLYDYPRKDIRIFNKNDELIFNPEIINKLNKNEGIYKDVKLILQNNRNVLIDKIQTIFENGQGKMVIKVLVD